MIRVVAISPQETHALRRSVLRDGDPQAEVVWPRDDDAETRHFGAMRDGSIVAIGTVYAAPVGPQGVDAPEAIAIPCERHWQFRGMASDPSARGGGYGAGVLAAILAHVREAGRGRPQLVWCNARLVAIGFYEKFAMRCVGPEFDIPTVGPHRVMLVRVD